MLSKIFRNELRRLWRDKTIGFIALIIFCAALFGAYNGARYARAQAAAQEKILAEENELFAKMQAEGRDIEAGEKTAPLFGNPLHAGSVGLFYSRTAALPPASFAFSSIGQADVYPTYFKVNGQRRESFMDATELENPTNLLIGRFDLAFVIIYLLPLVVIGLSYNLLSAEREGGTLTLLLAQGVKLRSLLGAKLSARALILLLPLLAAVSVAAVFFDATLLRLFLFGLAVIFYIAFWSGLAVLVNLYGGNSVANAVTLAAVWLALVLLVPTFVHLSATALRPVPSRLELIAASRDWQTKTRQPQNYLEAYYTEFPDRRPLGKDLTKYDFPLYWAAIQREMERRTAPVLERYETALEAQQDFVQTLSFISPALSAQEIFNDLAGTGYVRHRTFIEQVTQFHHKHRSFFEVKTFRDERLQASDYDRIPRFSFTEEAPKQFFSRLAWRLLPLLALMAIVGLAVWRKLLGKIPAFG